LYRHILGEYRMKELIDAVRVPIPKIVSDLRADLEKRKKDKEKKRTMILNYLSSLTVFSVMFSFLSAFNLVAFQWLGVQDWTCLSCLPKPIRWGIYLIACTVALVVFSVIMQIFLGADDESGWKKRIRSIRNHLGPISSDENDSTPILKWFRRKTK
jgi:hypothetical protein